MVRGNFRIKKLVKVCEQGLLDTTNIPIPRVGFPGKCGLQTYQNI